MGRCKLIGLGLIMVFVSGCGVGMKESLRGVAGVSTKVLEDNLSGADSKEFDLAYDAVYSQVQKIVKEIGAYVYAVDKSKNLIAIYVTEEDTTPVGIFFKGLDNNKTRVSISSPSKFAKEIISGKIFSGLEK
ncbi:MAG: hypothetical protein NTY14_06025 [Candidatus Omnitrophica bacterium]|nr:hypothetical protein [Candidatus Omnitrophota bacterium]